MHQLSEMRWESRFEIVEALHYHAAEFREAVLEVRDKATDGNITTEGQSVAEAVDSSFFFFSCCLIRHSCNHPACRQTNAAV